jgi:hypothetical protein
VKNGKAKKNEKENKKKGKIKKGAEILHFIF